LRAWLAAGAASRLDHRAAGRHIRPGWQVLDVGCGPGTFKNAIPQARYTGLDPFADAEAAAAGTLREGLREHAARRPAFYDAVCAFHVIEHTADPRAFAASLLGALKPGGLLIVSSPAWPSVMTRLPNFVFNAPPHHLTWWNARAYAALCGEFGLAPVEVSLIRGAQSNEKLQWMERLSPVKTAGVYFRHAYRWHLSLLWASLASHAAGRLNIRPGAAHDEDIICVARKPGP
jgi:2-polyprenyl-3-methyl-5-hydroxy-6-metoxy-1,4-benzoquinol methylase